MNIKDCSQGICSLYCLQWCYPLLPPPPPPPFPFPEENSSPKFSLLTIAVIVILASAFLLVTYYATISNYCEKKGSSRREENQDYPSVEMEENYQIPYPPNYEPLWYVAANGLDEALIKSIAVCKFKKGDGLVECTDCSVCLSKFEEDESLRLLPKCSHAFHVNCIDTWLRSHSNCPLCRANIETSVNVEALSEISNGGNGNGDVEDREIHERDAVIEIGEEGGKQITRSVSMDSSSRQCRVWMSNMNQDDEELQMESMSKSSHRNRVSSVAIKRSFSSGRFSFGRHGRGNIVIPL